MCKRYRIDNSKRKQHSALVDCELLSKVYINLIDQKEPKLEFTNENTRDKNLENSNISYFKKIVLPTNRELEDHKEYLEK